ncbi:MAG: S41 family peptidase [Bacteroidaceae bacterium]|nr:S41 family peptidase [Bacteroidaceae bacterium]
MKIKSLAIVSVVLTIGFSNTVCAKQDQFFEISKNIEIFHSIIRNLNQYYVDSIDINHIVSEGINEMLWDIDPYTVYYPHEKKTDLTMITTGKYAGIGAIISKVQDYPWIIINELYKEMPAHTAGLKVGDEILYIDGNDMKGKNTEYVSNNLRGTPNSTLVVTVRRPGVTDSLDITIIRKNIALPAVTYYGIIKGFGYILLDSFTENCESSVRLALKEMTKQGIKGLILDLRNNGGGLLDEAVKIVSLFTPEGTQVVTTKGVGQGESRSYTTRNKPENTKIPLAVLVNNESASASEIVAGALQDLDRAVIIGQRTYGKGLVQSTRNLPYGGMLKFTTAKYYIPSGRCIQAVDYSKRNADGSAKAIPDSLTKIFHTKSGREVRDGGGIRPDIECKVDTLPELVYQVSNSKIFVDYLNEYCVGHPTIDAAKDFSVSDSEFEEFKKYMAEHNFTYTSETSKIIEELKKVAESEKLLNIAREDIENFEKKTAYNPYRDMEAVKEPMKTVIGASLVRRYYFQHGVIEFSQKEDKTLDTAIDVLSNNARLKSILGN